MELKLFNPFARYVVVQLQRRYFEGEYGYGDSLDLVTPVHFCDEFNEAEQIASLLDAGRYEVRENAAWKSQEKHCERCQQRTGDLAENLCADCKAYAARVGQVDYKEATGKPEPLPRVPRADESDTPNTVPAGHGVWAKHQ